MDRYYGTSRLEQRHEPAGVRIGVKGEAGARPRSGKSDNRTSDNVEVDT